MDAIQWSCAFCRKFSALLLIEKSYVGIYVYIRPNIGILSHIYYDILIHIWPHVANFYVRPCINPSNFPIWSFFDVLKNFSSEIWSDLVSVEKSNQIFVVQSNQQCYWAWSSRISLARKKVAIDLNSVFARGNLIKLLSMLQF